MVAAHNRKEYAMKNKKGFTLVEIMIVVAIIGLLAAIAIPSFVKARAESQAKACVNNLRILDAAKEQAAMEQGWGNTEPIDGDTGHISNVLSYVKGQLLPTCPGGGAYTYNPIGTIPTCSVGVTHALPSA
jgi:prepilin-type N-terminal cleavage/methylation domain-containing protein